MRLLQLTDTHLTPSVSSRSDDYAAAILSKWMYVCEQAVSRGIDLIVHSGDVFDRSIVPRWLEHEVLRIVDECPIRHCFAVGTHDMGTGEPTTFGRSIGSLESQRNVYAFSGPHSKRVGDILLCGSCAEVDWDCGADVIAVHQMLTDTPVLWEHQLASKIQTSARYVLSGDYHPGWAGALQVDGTKFINPGAIARTFRSPHDLTRTPGFCIIDTDKDTVVWEPVPHADAGSIHIEREVPVMAEIRASVADAIADAKTKLGTDDLLELGSDKVETPAPLEAGMARLKELCEEVEKDE